MLYNKAREIIGGSFTFLDFAPVSGKAPAEVMVTSTGLPATFQLYESISSLSEFN